MNTKKTMVNKKPDESTIEATAGEVKKAPRKRKVKAAAVKVKASEPADKQAADKDPADKQAADKQAEEMFKSCEVDGASSEILGKAASHEEVAEPATEATPEEVDKAAKEAENVFDKCETQNADEEIVKTDDEAETTPNGAQFTDIEDKNLDVKAVEDDPFVKAISDIGSTAEGDKDAEISDDDIDGLDDILDDIDIDDDDDLDGLSADDMVDDMTDDELLDMIGEDPDIPADIEDLNGPIDKIDVKLSVPVTRVSNNGSTVRLFLDSENVWIVEVYLGAHRELRQKYDDDTTDVVNIDFTDNAVVINMPHGMKTLIKVYHADEE